jgi:hypothetical protein
MRSIQAIDRQVPHGRRYWKYRSRRCLESPKAVSPHLPPASPAIIKPPVMVVRSQPQTARRADHAQFAAKQKIPRDTKVMRPNQSVFLRSAAEQFLKRLTNLLTDPQWRSVLLREIPEARLDEQPNWHRLQTPPKQRFPFRIWPLTRRQHNLQASQLSNHVRRCQFNHPTHTARTQMVMHDYEPHSP